MNIKTVNITSTKDIKQINVCKKHGILGKRCIKCNAQPTKPKRSSMSRMEKIFIKPVIPVIAIPVQKSKTTYTSKKCIHGFGLKTCGTCRYL